MCIKNSIKNITFISDASLVLKQKVPPQYLGSAPEKLKLTEMRMYIFMYIDPSLDLWYYILHSYFSKYCGSLFLKYFIRYDNWDHNIIFKTIQLRQNIYIYIYIYISIKKSKKIYSYCKLSLFSMLHLFKIL